MYLFSNIFTNIEIPLFMQWYLNCMCICIYKRYYAIIHVYICDAARVGKAFCQVMLMVRSFAISLTTKDLESHRSPLALSNFRQPLLPNRIIAHVRIHIH